MGMTSAQLSAARMFAPMTDTLTREAGQKPEVNTHSAATRTPLHMCEPSESRIDTKFGWSLEAAQEGSTLESSPKLSPGSGSL